MVLFGLLAATAAAASASGATSYKDVQVGTVKLRVHLPQGYCVPTGEDATRFEELAAPDHKNVTLLSLVDCKDDAKSNKYLLMKIPVFALEERLDRADMIKDLSSTVEQPDFVTSMNSMPGDVGAAKSAATGIQTNLVGKYGSRGHDDVCVYFGGTVTTTIGSKTQTQAVGTCMTVIGSRFVALHAYEDSKDPEAYKRLLPRLKHWALRIEPVHHQ